MYLSWTGVGAWIHADAWACLCVSVWRPENHLGFSCFTSIYLPTPIFKRSRSFTDLELTKCTQFVGQKPSGIRLSSSLLGFALGLQAHSSRLRIFMSPVGLKFVPSCLYSEHFVIWTLSPEERTVFYHELNLYHNNW